MIILYVICLILSVFNAIRQFEESVTGGFGWTCAALWLLLLIIKDLREINRY